ncbi:hypothetical protein OG585_39760 [Streptomyces sp. NBC_01340]|uniref:hypothetical protein n=1 Tax=unclassified Streptomyces TaxID=2593676 RepID=UPI00224D6BD2|nr:MULTISPECIES: hypothetical protein [unclassified Streptomyces]MCX4458911.1 hypothetical protein [Streptomyces sp. NBC_01719]MCX4498268.1 hypothetical protein [Streptomyces sp. NBC_01728]WSI44464.1 hypothetical protein OG585_39760 [Streptomyces sp. NBC_01340]
MSSRCCASATSILGAGSSLTVRVRTRCRPGAGGDAPGRAGSRSTPSGTEQLPEAERHLYTESYLTDLLTVRLGGRAARLVVFGEGSTGAFEDLAGATQIAARMVREFGLSPALGPIGYGSGAPTTSAARAPRTRCGGPTPSRPSASSTRRPSACCARPRNAPWTCSVTAGPPWTPGQTCSPPARSSTEPSYLTYSSSSNSGRTATTPPRQGNRCPPRDAAATPREQEGGSHGTAAGGPR